MEYFLRFAISAFDSADRFSFLVIIWISAGCQHDTQSRTRIPARVLIGERSVDRCFADCRQVRLQSHHDRLCFRVAHAAVELYDLRRSVFHDHQPRVQKTEVVNAVLSHAIECRTNNEIHDLLLDIVGHYRCGRICAHATGIRPDVTFITGLVVLGCRERQHCVTVGYHDEARFFSVEKLFNDDSRASVAKTVALEHVRCSGLGFLQAHCHDYAFSCRQAIGFDNNWRALFPDVVQRGFEFAEVLIRAGWNVVTVEKVLRKCFRPFELSRRSAWPEAGQLQLIESINDAGDERSLRTNDRQADFFGFCECCESFNIIR